jgi:hypothetical protein
MTSQTNWKQSPGHHDIVHGHNIYWVKQGNLVVLSISPSLALASSLVRVQWENLQVLSLSSSPWASSLARRSNGGPIHFTLLLSLIIKISIGQEQQDEGEYLGALWGVQIHEKSQQKWRDFKGWHIEGERQSFRWRRKKWLVSGQPAVPAIK